MKFLILSRILIPYQFHSLKESAVDSNLLTLEASEPEILILMIQTVQRSWLLKGEYLQQRTADMWV